MADLIEIIDTDYVGISETTNSIVETEGDSVYITEVVPQVIEAATSELGLIVTNDPVNVVEVTDPIILISDTYIGSGGVNIWDEDILVAQNVKDINFSGSEVLVKDNLNGKVTVFIPTPSYVSHFNTKDGLNDATVADFPTSNRHISTPRGNFAIGNWIGDQLHQVVSSPILTYSTTVPFSFRDTTTTFSISILDATESNNVEYVTPPIGGNAQYSNQNSSILVNVSGWNKDADKFQGQIFITVNISSVFPNGGRFGISIQHNNGTEGKYFKVQNNLFFDTNTIAATISGTAISQGTLMSAKYLSGIRYYSINDSFNITSTGLDGINSNSYPDIVLNTTCDDYGISQVQVIANTLQNWTTDYDSSGTYVGVHKITKQKHRFVGGAAIHTAIMDWGIAKTINSVKSKVAIDTYPRSSTDLLENFDDEYYRQDSGFFSSNLDGNWISDKPLVTGEAMVFGGFLITPSKAFSIDNSPQGLIALPELLPKNEVGAPNPDYSTFSTPVNYYRTFVDKTNTHEILNWQIYIDGVFVGENINTDIDNGLIEIYIRRVASGMTLNVGAAATPLTIHGGYYNFNMFDDGVTNGAIRLGNSKGNKIVCTSGGIATLKGVHFHIRLLDARIKIDTIRFEFN